MRFLKKFIFILIIPTLAFTTAHKFYVSVSNIAYSEKDQSLQITTRVFIDDLEKALEERYGVKTKLATKNEVANASEYIEKYLNTKFNISVNGEPKQYVFIGRKYDTDMVICYLEVPKVNLKTTTTIGVQNELLMDVFEEQQNIVHFKINGKKKSFILIKESNKGMLNL